MSAASPPPAIARRLASALYDLLLTIALAIFVTFPFLAVFGDSTQGWRRQPWVESPNTARNGKVTKIASATVSSRS